MYTLGSDLRHSSAPMPSFNRAFKILNYKAPCISVSSMDVSGSLGTEGPRWTWLKLRHTRAHKAEAPSDAWRAPPSMQRPQSDNRPGSNCCSAWKPWGLSAQQPGTDTPEERDCPGTWPHRMRVSPPTRGTGEREPHPLLHWKPTPAQHRSPSLNFHIQMPPTHSPTQTKALRTNSAIYLLILQAWKKKKKRQENSFAVWIHSNTMGREEK